MEMVLAETMLANIAVYSWWCTEGLQMLISLCNCMAAESASRKRGPRSGPWGRKGDRRGERWVGAGTGTRPRLPR